MSNLSINITENGTTTLATSGKYCDRNVDIVVDVASSGGGGEVEPIVLTGDCSYACSGAMASKYIELFGDTISTDNLGNIAYMFSNYKNDTIPFELNGDTTNYKSCNNLFSNALSLKEVPKMNNFYPSDIGSLFNYCRSLRVIPYSVFNNWNFSRLQSYGYATTTSIFANCFSLREYPNELLQELKNTNATYSYVFYRYCFQNCYSLDEVVNLPVITSKTYDGGTSDTYSLFNNMLVYCGRLKRFTFEKNEDGTSIVAPWSNQILDLTKNVGWSYTEDNIINNGYHSGITIDKFVQDDEDYQALKNDPDWFTINSYYSRYNKTSALETIRSLPNTTNQVNVNAGKSNTIKFYGNAGKNTDGGAINTLTDSEIMIASGKGWNVALS